MRLERYRLAHGRLVRQASLVAGIAAGSVHDSGRIAFAPDRSLYVSTGDAGRPELAQDPRSLNGKFLALSPAQYRGNRQVRPDIVSLGHRNAQGFDWQPGTGRLLATEHGPTGFDGDDGWDEVNTGACGRWWSTRRRPLRAHQQPRRARFPAARRRPHPAHRAVRREGRGRRTRRAPRRALVTGRPPDRAWAHVRSAEC